MASRTSSRNDSGRVKITAAGCVWVSTTSGVVPEADATIYRGRNGGVVELGLRTFDRRLVGRDRRLEAIDLSLLLIDILLGLKTLYRQGCEADQVLLSGHQLGFILALLRIRLVERRLEQARVDLGKHVARFH